MLNQTQGRPSANWTYWAPRWSYLLSVFQVHTIRHCRFYREQHWAPHLLRPALTRLHVKFSDCTTSVTKSQSLNECRMNRRPHCLDYCIYLGERRGRDRMVVGFTTTCAISAYHH
jgi:hypothetical protein